MKCSLALTFSLVALGVAPRVAAQLPPPPTPVGNPTTPDKANLGKALFWDEQLSSSNTVACATCHSPKGGGADPRAAQSVHPGPDGLFGTEDDINGSFGLPLSLANGDYIPSQHFRLDVQVTGRLAPTAINAAYSKTQFWDGREDGAFEDPLNSQPLLTSNASLENQASRPPVGDAEMAHQGRGWQDVADRVAVVKPLALATNIPQPLANFIGNKTYPQLFKIVFGDDAVTPARIIMAIAAYERVLISDQTPFDFGTLTPAQQRGLDLFNNKAACEQCHAGSLFRNQNFHNIGLRPSAEDVGRFAVTNDPADMGAFKTPGLRNVGLRPAFMHNGGHKSLSEVIDFYDRGGDFHQDQDPLIQPLNLTAAEKADLLDFLQNGLTDWRVRTEWPPFDVPTLYSDTARVPQGYGAGVAGTGGFIPRLVAIEPPVLGNPSFTIGLTDGTPGTVAAVAIDAVRGSGTPILGVPIWVGGSGGTAIIPIPNLEDGPPGWGWWSDSFAMPASSSLAGTQLFLQAFAFDPQGPQGVTGSAGVEFTLFAER